MNSGSYKRRIIPIIVSIILLWIGCLLMINGSSITNSLLNTSVNAVDFVEIYSMRFSIISISIMLFFFGLSILFVEYIFSKISHLANADNTR